MIIAVPSEANGAVSQHFGHAPEFVFADVADGRIISQRSVKSPGHRPGVLPRYLAEQGAQVVITGGVGASATDIFRQLGVAVVTGAKGKVSEVLEQYISGQLQSTDVACTEHAHHDQCEEH